MLVETYEVEETNSEAGTLAADHEALELIEKLNLVGQLGLTNTDTVERFPYRKLTKNEAQVFRVLCPVTAKLESYSDGPIPLRVLQVAAHVQQTEFCNYIEIWHPENADIKDPFLIGVKKVGQWEEHRYLLARWGEELLSMQQMTECAKRLWHQKMLPKLYKAKREIESAIADADAGNLTLGETMSFYA